jgi:glycine hydroxymethyltransferase
MADAPSTALKTAFLSQSLGAADPELAAAVGKEIRRQQTQIELIASENIVSRAVLGSSRLAADQ